MTTTDRQQGVEQRAREIRILTGNLSVLEDMLTIYAELYGTAEAERLFERALLLTERGRPGKPLRVVRLCAELRRR